MFGVMDEVGILDRQSSIENEPRTLNVTQIDFARETALYVVNTKTIEEALNIFTKKYHLGGGIHNHVKLGKGNAGLRAKRKSHQIYQTLEKGLEPVVRCECECECLCDNGSCSRWNDDIAAGIRDIASAPF